MPSLGVHVHWMLIGACNPMAALLWVVAMGGCYGWVLWVVAMGGCYGWMLIGACNPMAALLPTFPSPLLPSSSFPPSPSRPPAFPPFPLPSLPPTHLLLLPPDLFRYGVDRLGKRAVLATGASVALMGVHSVLGLTRIAPYGPLVGQGLAYSIFAAALWPSVSRRTPLFPRIALPSYSVSVSPLLLLVVLLLVPCNIMLRRRKALDSSMISAQCCPIPSYPVLTLTLTPKLIQTRPNSPTLTHTHPHSPTLTRPHPRVRVCVSERTAPPPRTASVV